VYIFILATAFFLHSQSQATELKVSIRHFKIEPSDDMNTVRLLARYGRRHWMPYCQIHFLAKLMLALAVGLVSGLVIACKVFVHRTCLTAVHRQANLGQLAPLLLLSLVLHPASQLHCTGSTRLEDEKRAEHPRLSALAKLTVDSPQFNKHNQCNMLCSHSAALLS
jgi:hypothetical protein